MFLLLLQATTTAPRNAFLKSKGELTSAPNHGAAWSLDSASRPLLRLSCGNGRSNFFKGVSTTAVALRTWTAHGTGRDSMEGLTDSEGDETRAAPGAFEGLAEVKPSSR
jgi:hypothetical protein